MKSIYKVCLPAVAMAFAFAAVTAFAQPSTAVKDDKAQMKSDKAGLQREETRLKADTGSGEIRAENVDLEEFRGDTGSGNILVQATGARLRRVVADTGSGDITVHLPPDASFELNADVGSGDIVSRFADAQPIVHNRTVVGYRRAEGRTRIDVDTGSGDVTVAPR